MSERVAARSWQGGGAPRTGGAQANDNEARCDAAGREPGIPIRVSSKRPRIQAESSRELLRIVCQPFEDELVHSRRIFFGQVMAKPR